MPRNVMMLLTASVLTRLTRQYQKRSDRDLPVHIHEGAGGARGEGVAGGVWREPWDWKRVTQVMKTGLGLLSELV